MWGVFDFLRETTAGRGGGIIGGYLLDQEDIGKATFTELPDDLEAILIDLDISSAINSVI